jgi:hypothetical protein
MPVREGCLAVGSSRYMSPHSYVAVRDEGDISRCVDDFSRMCVE